VDPKPEPLLLALTATAGATKAIKIGAGRLMAGRFGAPGAERYDVYGRALNELFRIAWADFAITPAAAALL